MVTGEVRVRVARFVEDAAVATGERVHPGPRVVAERDDAGGGLDRVGERTHTRATSSAAKSRSTGREPIGGG